MTEHQKKVQQAIDLMMQLDDIDTETELRAYIENARRQAAKNGGVCNDG